MLQPLPLTKLPAPYASRVQISRSRYRQRAESRRRHGCSVCFKKEKKGKKGLKKAPGRLSGRRQGAGLKVDPSSPGWLEPRR